MIKYWIKLLREFNGFRFEDIRDNYGSLDEWKKEANKLINIKTLEYVRQRTIIDKTFPTLELF